MMFSKSSPNSALLPGAIWLLVALAGGWADPVLPAAPEGLILDQAQILLPERAAALSHRLRAAAAAQSVWVYIVTVPALEEPPSRRQERQQRLAHTYADGWIKGVVGVVMLVDDGSGEAIVVASAEADRQFPAWRRNLLVTDALRAGHGDRFVREKVERAAVVLLKVLSEAQEQARAARRRDRWVFLVTAVLVGGGMTALLLARRGRTAAASLPPQP